jgi:polysaccharide export outer membrane protein/exopolysaccharide production protein ExoF
MRLTALLTTLMIFSASNLAHAGEPYVLEDGDLVKVTVYGRTDLSGSFRVQADQTLPLPLLGSFKAENKSAAALERLLSLGYQQRLGTPLAVTVEVEERRPFYALGIVNQPGPYPHREGMSVLHALAIAGGLRKTADADSRLLVDVYRESGQYGSFLQTLKSALAEQARYLALRDAQEKVTAPTRLSALAGPEETTRLISLQQQILDAYRSDQQRQLTLYTEQESTAREELAAYQAQLAAIDEQNKLVVEELQRVQRLRDTGLGLESKVFEMKRDLSALTGNKRAAIAAVVRARQSIATAQSSLTSLKALEATYTNDNLARLETEIGLASARLQASQNLINALGDISTTPEAYAEQGPMFQITRSVSGNQTTIAASAETPILPGDILQVAIPPREIGATAQR